LFQNKVPLPRVCLAEPEAELLESEKYLQFAKDCIRIAEKMDAKDRQILLDIAKAWGMRAHEAEKSERKSDGR
jgi:hypothetical protein